ncbi:MAG: VanZ family protein [Zetaproteobacteria bacterium]|nr:MAG: VanZ family protein [Zetaproteobacteria bacterium]
MSVRLYRLLLVCWCALIFTLSAQSTLPGADMFAAQDKIEHMGAYAVMAWLFWRSFPPREGGAAMAALAAVLFCMLYGLSDEWHQSFVPGRMPDINDWLADSVGAMLLSGCMLYRQAKALEAGA